MLHTIGMAVAINFFTESTVLRNRETSGNYEVPAGGFLYLLDFVYTPTQTKPEQIVGILARLRRKREEDHMPPRFIIAVECSAYDAEGAAIYFLPRVDGPKYNSDKSPSDNDFIPDIMLPTAATCSLAVSPIDGQQHGGLYFAHQWSRPPIQTTHMQT